jgi:hypothetical protein
MEILALFLGAGALGICDRVLRERRAAVRHADNR